MECEHFETYIRVCPDRVWAALTDPELTRGYYLGLSVDSGWEPGGSITYRGPCPGVVGGQILACDAGAGLLVHSITDTGCSEGEPQQWVSWSVSSYQNMCRVRLELSSLDGGAGGCAEEDGGWAFVLACLKTLLETGAPMWSRPALADDE